MSKPFDYSKWDNIELSDDESDCHPNIDKDSWFRLKHRTRLEREEREDIEVAEIEKIDQDAQARINEINARLKVAAGVANGEADEDAEFIDTEALEAELNDLKAQMSTRAKRVHEIKERRKWNIDNICRVKDEKTIVNDKISAKSLDAEHKLTYESGDEESDEEETLPAPATSTTTSTSASPPVAPETVKTTTTTKAPVSNIPTVEPKPTIPSKKAAVAVQKYNEYVLEHQDLLERFCETQDMEETKQLLRDNCDILLHEHSQTYILLSCLEDEMNGKHQRMRLVCRQSQILTHITDLGKSMRRDPRDVMLPFFAKLSEGQYLMEFLKTVSEFVTKIQQRAVVKRQEMDAEAAQEEEDDEDDEDPVGPGGLRPSEVFPKLPQAMQDAFESQDIGRLQSVLASMDPAQAKHWMKQCVDSGLWVAADSSIFDE